MQNKMMLIGLAALLMSFSAKAQENPFAKIEAQTGGRVGVFAFDTGTGKEVSHRPNDKFMMCSTFKFLLCAHVLHLVDTKKETLDRRVFFSKKDLLKHSPITSQHVESGMTIGELCAATVQHSDNAAANVLLKIQGGPKALTAYLRSVGDQTTRLDRFEPELNQPAPGKDFDTSTPAAMAKTLETLLVKKTLSEASRKQLVDWLLGNTTGDKRLRAGIPANWKMGEKTGTGYSVNDVGIMYPPTGAPIVVAVFITESKKPGSEIDSAIAASAKIVVEQLGTTKK